MNDSLITFTGWVGNRVEVDEVRDDVQVATFRVGSTPRRIRDGRWEDGETVWHTVKAWRQLATHLGQSLRTGDPVLVTGRLTAESWTKEDGSVATRHVVVATAVGHDLGKGVSDFRRSRAEGTRDEARGEASDPWGRPGTVPGTAPETGPETVPEAGAEPQQESVPEPQPVG